MPLYFTLRRIPERDAIALLAEMICNSRMRECRKYRWGRA